MFLASFAVMQRPTPQQLLSFFQSDIFRSAPLDFENVIQEFYNRFDPLFDQEAYHEIGIHINRVVREPYIIEEGEAADYKITVYFHFLTNPEEELSFILWGELEEQPFLTSTKEQLLDFFEFRFRRFQKRLIR